MAKTEIDSTKILENLLLENLKENRRRRRWGIFFKLILIFLLFIFLGFLIETDIEKSANFNQPHSAIIDIYGAIMPDSLNSADQIVSSLTKAFRSKQTKGIILHINSPGGSPVQASDIFNNILRLRKKYPKIKIYAVCSDVCASAAYYIASATNQIYANPSSLVGSIGVLFNGFGFVDTMKKLGIQRRLITAGTNKGFLDPFSPMTPKQTQYAQQMLDQIQKQFIQAVEEGRGNRLKKTTPGIFSGQIWTGITAEKLGLIDGFASTGKVARNIIKAPKIANYSPKRSFFNQLSGTMGAEFTQSVVASLFNHNWLQ